MRIWLQAPARRLDMGGSRSRKISLYIAPKLLNLELSEWQNQNQLNKWWASQEPTRSLNESSQGE